MNNINFNLNLSEDNSEIILKENLQYIDCFNLFKNVLNISKSLFKEMFFSYIDFSKESYSFDELYNSPNIVIMYQIHEKDTDLLIAINSVIYYGNKIAKSCDTSCLKELIIEEYLFDEDNNFIYKNNLQNFILILNYLKSIKII